MFSSLYPSLCSLTPSTRLLFTCTQHAHHITSTRITHPQLSHIPTIGHTAPLLSYISAWKYLKDSGYVYDTIEEGYHKVCLLIRIIHPEHSTKLFLIIIILVMNENRTAPERSIQSTHSDFMGRHRERHHQC